MSHVALVHSNVDDIQATKYIMINSIRVVLDTSQSTFTRNLSFSPHINPIRQAERFGKDRHRDLG